MKISLIGYYGFNNLGDDLMLLNLLNYISQISSIKKISVLCKKNYFPSISKVNYLEYSKNKYMWPLTILTSNYVIWGGGTCIYESNDNTGIFWLSRMQNLTKFGKGKFCFLGIGIGNLRSVKIKTIAQKLLQNSDFICFREEESYNTAAQILHFKKDACIGGDLVFLDTSFFPRNKSNNTRNSIKNISFSGIYSLDNETAMFYAKELQRLSDYYNANIHFISAHRGVSNDDDFHRNIRKHMSVDCCEAHKLNNSDEYLQILANMDFHIGMRLHSIVCADIMGIPNIAINYSPKVEYYVNKTGVLSNYRIFQLNNEISYQAIDYIFSNFSIPESFINSERQGSRACIDKMFHL